MLRCGYYKTTERKHGRTETRKVYVFEPSEAIKGYIQHIAAVVRVERLRTTKGITTREVVYYISDVKYSAKEFSKGIRGHWNIENRLHWVKDVVMLEDSYRNNNVRLAPILSILKSNVINIAYTNSKSVINFQRTIAHNVALMSVLLE